MHNDLLKIAQLLANVDKKRPKQANLRQAVSAIYYGMFHFLIDRSCRSIIGTQPADVPYRNVLARAFTHTEMNECCKRFQYGAGSLLKLIVDAIPGIEVAPETMTIASTFCTLQQNRFDADYNMQKSFGKADVLGLIDQTETAIRNFDQLGLDNSKRLFLSCLWAWNKIIGRSHKK